MKRRTAELARQRRTVDSLRRRLQFELLLLRRMEERPVGSVDGTPSDLNDVLLRAVSRILPPDDDGETSADEAAGGV